MVATGPGGVKEVPASFLEPGRRGVAFGRWPFNVRARSPRERA